MSPPEHISIDASTLAAAERLAGLRFSDADRQMILEDIDVQLARTQLLRSVGIENHHASASIFDPRLPGTVLPRGRPRIFTRRDSPRPADPEGVAFAATLDQAKWLREGTLTSVELTQIYLDRIERYDVQLNAFVCVQPERALRAARAADEAISAGQWRGPLHGIPWAAKDLLATAELPTTWGTTPFRAQQFDVNACVVERLEAQGAVLLGKTALGALAMGDVWFGGQVRNPFNLAEGSSGSSAGSGAAVSAGLASFALGSETMGSILNPSVRCGTVGLRPTFGRVPRTGAMALAWSLDKIGPLCRTAEDAIAILADINGADGDDRCAIDAALNYDAQESIAKMRIGFHPTWFEQRSLERDLKVLDTLRSGGAELVEVTLPQLPYEALWTILFSEAAAAFDTLTVSGQDQALERQDAHAWPNLLRKARFISAVDHIQAERFRLMVMREMQNVFDRVDVLIGGLYAPNLQLITNCTGHPAMAIRTGLIERPARTGFHPINTLVHDDESDSAHVPHGLAIWGNLYREDHIARVAAHLETALGIEHEPPQAFRGP